MKKSISILAAGLLLAGAATSCASLDKMAEMAEKVKVTCNPEVLEAVGGNVDAVITVTYPAEGLCGGCAENLPGNAFGQGS